MVPMQRLTWVSGSFSAHVLRARLCSEGIDAELRGAIDGPYALTVGDMARVDVYVPAIRWTTPSCVMLAGEVDAALAAPREWGGTPKRGPRCVGPRCRIALSPPPVGADRARTRASSELRSRALPAEHGAELVAFDASERACRRVPLRARPPRAGRATAAAPSVSPSTDAPSLHRGAEREARLVAGLEHVGDRLGLHRRARCALPRP